MKTAIITGGSSGVGLSIVKAVATKNYHIFFIGTNKEKGLAIEKTLNNSTNSKVTFVLLDLSSLIEIDNFIRNFKLENTKLDLLVNVAGVMHLKQKFTKIGYDKTFTVGYLSAFKLTTELAPLLKKGTNPRIVNVGGKASHVLKTKLDFNNIDFKLNYNGIRTAIQTIHTKTVLTAILADKFKVFSIDVISFHPGIVRSNLSRNMPFVLRFFTSFIKPFMSKESKNGIYAALSNKLIGVTGKLIVSKKEIDLNFDAAYKDKIWTLSNQLIQL